MEYGEFFAQVTGEESPFAYQRRLAESQNVSAELEGILAVIDQPSGSEALRLAAIWHDRGKAHDCFQRVLTGLVDYRPDSWAKAPGKWPPYPRKYFRHELASAIAVLHEDRGQIPEDLRSLVAFLIAAHHGKVRLSIRSMPREAPPETAGVRFARGIHEGDVLQPAKLADGVEAPEVRLDLECMQMGRGRNGQPSWAERMLALRDRPDLGPFRLAYLEALLRAADRRASRKEGDADD